MASQRVLVLPDMQIYAINDDIAGLDLETWRAVLKYIDDYKWDEVIILGDFLDFNCISHHNKDLPRLTHGQSVTSDYRAGNKILDQLQKAAEGAKITLLEGNHEYRYERLTDALPVFEGLMDVEDGLRLKERGIKYVRAWSKGDVYEIGKANFIHGLYINEFHAKKHVMQFGTNIFYGHTHDVQSYSQILRGDNKTIVGQSLGCLCVYDLPYMRGRPSKWQQAFGVFHFLPDGFFNYTVTRIFKHRFVSPEGRLYGA